MRVFHAPDHWEKRRRFARTTDIPPSPRLPPSPSTVAKALAVKWLWRSSRRINLPVAKYRAPCFRNAKIRYSTTPTPLMGSDPLPPFARFPIRLRSKESISTRLGPFTLRRRMVFTYGGRPCAVLPPRLPDDDHKTFEPCLEDNFAILDGNPLYPLGCAIRERNRRTRERAAGGERVEAAARLKSFGR